VSTGLPHSPYYIPQNLRACCVLMAGDRAEAEGASISLQKSVSIIPNARMRNP